VWADQFRQLSDNQKLELLGRVRKEKEWVKGQVEQHEGGHKTQHRWAVNLRRWGFGLAVVGWAMLFGLFSSTWWAPALEKRLASVAPQPAAATPAAEHPGRGGSAAEHGANAHAPLSPRHPPDSILILASCLVITGGLCIAYCERRAHEELSKQYERMAILFANGDRELADRLAQRDITGAQRVIAALGHEAIVEHAQWLILRRARQLELHIGG
jgi:hypothetical protein